MIKREDRNLGERAYDQEHFEAVLKEISLNFSEFFLTFAKGTDPVSPLIGHGNFKVVVKSKPATVKTRLAKVFNDAIERRVKEQPLYVKMFDLESLEEDEDDPNAFKKALSKQIPIINRCLNSTAREMQRYKGEFHQKSGREMLNVTTAIMKFGKRYSDNFNEQTHENAVTVSELGLSELLQEQYVSYNVIGGGIKSNFLHSLYPNAFAYRSQNALWALWYLTGKKNFGFSDGSEFLMIDVEKGTTQQNYHYPYDLFSFYALKIYLLLKDACNAEGIIFENRYRYIYLDTFLDHIADIWQREISDLKKTGDYAE